MFAVFETGGKQYTCRAGTKLAIESLPNEVGETVLFDTVLMLSDDKTQIGTPYVQSAQVEAKVLDHGRHKKVTILKFKRRKHHMKSMGHRQNFTQIEVTNIHTGA